jgi:hypothetical protein
MNSGKRYKERRKRGKGFPHIFHDQLKRGRKGQTRDFFAGVRLQAAPVGTSLTGSRGFRRPSVAARKATSSSSSSSAAAAADVAEAIQVVVPYVAQAGDLLDAGSASLETVAKLAHKAIITLRRDSTPF